MTVGHARVKHSHNNGLFFTRERQITVEHGPCLRNIEVGIGAVMVVADIVQVPLLGIKRLLRTVGKTKRLAEIVRLRGGHAVHIG